ncbi:HNH endonuclease [Stomatohabitans albus]|uniref:HNH endonuclease n=1 Tax=Stomatohabitans albus TaxID=3110766 RepID=UPI00300CC385
MPRAPLKACTLPGCTNQVQRGRCKDHRPPSRVNTQRSDPFYGSTRWYTIRARHLAEEPQCRLCGSTRRLQVDHIIARQDGGTDDPWNLQTLCIYCHSRKTYRENGALNRPTKTFVRKSLG